MMTICLGNTRTCLSNARPGSVARVIIICSHSPHPAESCRTYDNIRNRPHREAGSGATGHVAALEPVRAEWWSPEPQNMRLHQSPPELGGRVRNHGTHGSTGALPC
jgi:hypothetical protein